MSMLPLHLVERSDNAAFRQAQCSLASESPNILKNALTLLHVAGHFMSIHRENCGIHDVGYKYCQNQKRPRISRGRQ